MDATQLTVFLLANIGIVAGYVYAGLFVAPVLPATRRSTKFWGFWFFLLCAATHAELALHAAFDVPLDFDELTSWHMLAIHAPQAVAIWMFLIGMRRDLLMTRVPT